MSAEELLRSNEKQALKNNQIIANVSGKAKKPSKTGKKSMSVGATGFVAAMVLFFGVLFSSGNIIPSIISDQLIEETDVQYADAVESKKIVFQQAMREGEIPNDTERILEDEGFLVEKDEESGEIFLQKGERIISADDFVREVSNDAELYKAFNDATYNRAAYYYDESAKKVFREIGTSRNNFTEDDDFEEAMSKLIGEGSDIDVNTVGLVEKEVINQETGEKSIIYEYEELGNNAKSNVASNFISAVGEKNHAASTEEATMNSADSLKVADTIAKEQKSSLFYVAFMENISKMKAGEGNNSKINEAMNYIHEREVSEVVDVKTGEIVTVEGAPIESPSLYAILTNSKVDVDAVENYSSDRILKTVGNAVGNNTTGAVSGTVASAEKNVKGSIGRYINNGSSTANQEALRVVEPTINSSLVNNSFSSTKGINAGELLVEGAVNVGKSLAKASGATAGDEAAINSYARLNNAVLAMDRKVERMEKSPFDITSKNTFLGSIFYNLAIISLNNKGSSFFSGVKNFSSLVGKSINSIGSQSLADASDGYLSSFGDCITLPGIDATGSPQCTEIATYDISTLNDPYHDAGFIEFINNNTTLSSGVRTVNQNSALADFIVYNDERKTPNGVVDGGILESLKTQSSSVSFVSNILNMVKTSLGMSESDKRIANGAAFVNSSSNSDWQVYKYAQRYVSLARAAAALKQYSSDKTAYNNILYFEGSQNPVTAFLESFYASNDDLVVFEVVD
ncbi:hypothetical protein J6S37_02270 [Candidatus Saccharibacteria bacterium]|nr:hypothetical protein [Candidatus Saccharibacteria bacterium]